MSAIGVVTYSRFDFTDDLRLPRSNASPKKGYCEKRNTVAILSRVIKHTVDPIKMLLQPTDNNIADKLPNCIHSVCTLLNL